MAVALTAAGPFAERRRRVAELRSRSGFARQLLDFYGALLGTQESAFADAGSSQPAAETLAAYVAEVVVPGVVDVSVAAGPDRLRGDLMSRLAAADPRGIVERWIRGDDQPPIDRYLARASLGPVLEALGHDARST